MGDACDNEAAAEPSQGASSVLLTVCIGTLISWLIVAGLVAVADVAVNKTGRAHRLYRRLERSMVR